MSRDSLTKRNQAGTSRIELGKVVGVWGVKGWLKIYSYTRQRQDIGQYDRWLLVHAGKSGNSTDVEVTQCRLQGQNVVAKLKDIDDRNAAEALIGRIIYIDEHQLKPLPDGEFYWFQLVGMDVVTLSGQILGVVDSMMETGANDVFVVHGAEDGQSVERLIPYIDSVVSNVDFDNNQITVDWDAEYLVSARSQ